MSTSLGIVGNKSIVNETGGPNVENKDTKLCWYNYIALFTSPVLYKVVFTELQSP